MIEHQTEDCSLIEWQTLLTTSMSECMFVFKVFCNSDTGSLKLDARVFEEPRAACHRPLRLSMSDRIEGTQIKGRMCQILS